MQSLVACRVANLAFLKPNVEIQAFLTHLALFENKSYQSKSGFFFFTFFSLKDFALAKHCLSCIYITNIFRRESRTIAGCKEYCKDFTVALKCFDVFNKKQMYDSVFTGKEIAYKNLNCILSMFLTSFNIYCIFVWLCMSYCMCSLHVLGLLYGLFWLFLRHGLPFLVNLVACRRRVMAKESC